MTIVLLPRLINLCSFHLLFPPPSPSTSSQQAAAAASESADMPRHGLRGETGFEVTGGEKEGTSHSPPGPQIASARSAIRDQAMQHATVGKDAADESGNVV